MLRWLWQLGLWLALLALRPSLAAEPTGWVLSGGDVGAVQVAATARSPRFVLAPARSAEPACGRAPARLDQAAPLLVVAAPDLLGPERIALAAPTVSGVYTAARGSARDEAWAGQPPTRPD